MAGGRSDRAGQERGDGHRAGRREGAEPSVENFLTRAVVDAFSTNGRLRVVGPDAADSILEGEVTGYDVQSIAFDATANVRQYRLIVTLNLRYRDVKEEKLLFDRRGYQDRADFRVTGSVSSTIALEQVALSAASVEIARSIVAFTLEEWLRQRAQAEGLVVSEEGARLLVQHVGEDSATLLGEVRKAALAGGPENRAVSVKEVSAVVGEHRLSGLFDLTRAVERHELGLALRTLDRLLATEDPLPLLVALTRDVRMRWTVREWRERGRPAAEIARLVGRPPAVVDALLTSVAGESNRGLTRKLEQCWLAERSEERRVGKEGRRGEW